MTAWQRERPLSHGLKTLNQPCLPWCQVRCVTSRFGENLEGGSRPEVRRQRPVKMGRIGPTFRQSGFRPVLVAGSRRVKLLTASGARHIQCRSKAVTLRACPRHLPSSRSGPGQPLHRRSQLNGAGFQVEQAESRREPGAHWPSVCFRWLPCAGSAGHGQSMRGRVDVPCRGPDPSRSFGFGL
jgi:hypothetical protein